MLHRVVFLLTAALFLVGGVHAQASGAVRVEASAQPTTVGADGRVTFTLRIEGTSPTAVETPSPPPTRNLVLQQRTPSTEESLTFEDGQAQRSVTYKWEYRPLRTGTARIEPVTVQVRGESYTTGEIRLRVVSPSAQPSSSSQSETGALDEAEARAAAQLGRRSLFIRGRSSASTAYQNEQITVEYRLFFRPDVRLRRSRMADAWDAPGFWREELDVSSRPVPETETAYGQTYNTIVLKRVALFPTRAGTLEIRPLRIETEAQGAGQAFRGRYETLTLASDPLSVEVQPLPSGAPSAFEGAVGRFSIAARQGADSVAVGGGTEVAVRVRGTGNLPMVSAPVVDAPSDVAVYGPEMEDDLDRDGEAVRGSKTFTYTLVPTAGGRHVVPPVRFTYFNPGSRRYETVQTDSIVLRASGTAEPVATSRTGQGLPVGDIAGLMTTNVRWVSPDPTPLHRQWGAYGAVLVAVVLGLGGVAYRRRRGGMVESDPREEEEAASDPLADVHAHLREARQYEADARARYRSLERAVRTFLSVRLGVAPDCSRSRLDDHLRRHSVPAADREALHELLEACDRVQFTPERPGDSSTNVLKHTQALLRRLDNALPSA
jgi:hypothetical protein